MTTCDFCVLEVQILRSARRGDYTALEAVQQFFSNIRLELDSLKGMTHYTLSFKFTNKQLHSELQIIDSVSNGNESFSFSVWNVPTDVTLKPDDILIFKYYWESDPQSVTQYHGIVESVEKSRTNADTKVTAKGSTIHHDILYNTSIAKVYPKIDKFHQVKDMIEVDIGLKFMSNHSTFYSMDSLLETPILTKAKTVGRILDEVCQQLGDEFQWKIFNTTDVYIYSLKEFSEGILQHNENVITRLNEDTNKFDPMLQMHLLSVDISDVLELKDVDDYNIEVELMGLPTLKAGAIFQIDCENAPAYLNRETKNYVIDEIKQDITIASGFISTIYAHEVGHVNESELFDEYED